MNNPWYNRVNAVYPAEAPAQPGYQPQRPVNPWQAMNQISQAMRNPAAYLKQCFPDIPDQIMNDPNRILGYLQQSRGITDEQIRQIQNSMPHW